MRKYSKQKEAIRTYLTGRTDHPCAEQIYTAVKEMSPTVSLGTVYRNLGILVEDGELARISCGDGSEHYDPRTDMHGHFYCTACGELTDVETPGMPGMKSKISKAYGADVGAAMVVFNGVCGKCLKK